MTRQEHWGSVAVAGVPAAGRVPVGTGPSDAQWSSDISVAEAVTIHGRTSKSTPVDADELGLVDSEAAFVLKRLTVLNLQTKIVAAASAAILNGAPGQLDTLKELADAINDDANFASTITALIGLKMALAGAETVTGVKTFSAAPVFNALPTGTAVATAATPSTLIARDGSGDVFGANFFPNVTTIATAGGSAALANTNGVIVYTGTSTHTTTLVSTSIPAGFPLTLINLSTGVVTVLASGNGQIGTITPGNTMVLLANTNTPTTPAHWTVVNRQAPRVKTYTSSTTPTADADSNSGVVVSALAAGALIQAPTGTPKEGQEIWYRIKDNGTAQTFGFDTSTNWFQAIGVIVPTSTVLGKWLYLGTRYNATDSRWDIVAMAQQA